MTTWYKGLNQLVELVIALHKRDELELETVNAASKACSECWTIAGNWAGFDEVRNRVREIGGKLKSILDENERTYRGLSHFPPMLSYLLTTETHQVSVSTHHNTTSTFPIYAFDPYIYVKHL